MTLTYNLAYQEIISASYKASDFCWQTILYILKHLRPSHIQKLIWRPNKCGNLHFILYLWTLMGPKVIYLQFIQYL